ncbi:microspherule protein 1 [Anopheles moucheti]|uniref:microspherule protein 1 n=1 Tax=Anopheles moucheti TaxID=186751 RepID=UPI0022EFDE2E|nr:microspherule protein 1 [Anopheles moucheti]
MDANTSISTETTMECSTPTSASDLANDQKRRISSRSIKRKRFDDEIVEFSMSSTPIQQIKSVGGRSRTLSQSMPPLGTVPGPGQVGSPGPSTTGPTGSPTIPTEPMQVAASILQTPTIPAAVVAPPPPPTPTVTLPPPPTPNPATSILQQLNSNASVNDKKRALRNSKKTKKKSASQQVATKDLGRWKPMDDLALITGILQTNDLRTVHRGTKFSCKFTIQEMQIRWCSLLYDESISRIAVSAMRNMHPELVESVQSKALFSVAEEELLGTIKSSEQPTLEMFQELLNKNSSVFYHSRTAKNLLNHWQLMKQYSLLPDQPVQSLPKNDNMLSFSDAEDLMNDAELGDPRDEALETELALADRKSKKEIRHLENELNRWSVLVDSLTGIGFSPDFDNQTLAAIRGRMVRFLMRSQEIVLGRSTKDSTVDVDLSLEGPACKVSRKQGSIKLRSNGDFFITNEGKRPLYIDGRPLLCGHKTRLNDNCVIEISNLRFVFLINHDFINAVRQESAKMNIPLN